VSSGDRETRRELSRPNGATNQGKFLLWAQNSSEISKGSSRDLIAYFSRKGGNRINIWTVRPDGSGARRVTNRPGESRQALVVAGRRHARPLS
jgi:hypothetical protein